MEIKKMGLPWIKLGPILKILYIRFRRIIIIVNF
jgi:hypothetical protein